MLKLIVIPKDNLDEGYENLALEVKKILKSSQVKETPISDVWIPSFSVSTSATDAFPQLKYPPISNSFSHYSIELSKGKASNFGLEFSP